MSNALKKMQSIDGKQNQEGDGLSDVADEALTPDPSPLTPSVERPTQPTTLPPLVPLHKSELPLKLLAETKDWAQVFGRGGPLGVEIGCGGGRTAIGMALSRPDWNFIGCERAGEYYRVLLERAEKRLLPNFRITRADATVLLARFFPAASVHEYHIYFPDPWPKKRHHKRRLMSESFCAELRRTLIPNGVLYFATDHAEYYEELLPRVRLALDVREHPQPWPDAPEGRTNYEIKYLKQGRPIYRFVATNAKA